MTPEAVLAGKFDNNIPFSYTSDGLLDKARARSECKGLTAELVYAIMRRRESFRIEQQGNEFVRGINASLSNVTVPVDLWTSTGEVNSHVLKWLLVRGARGAYSTWEQWGMAGGQRVRGLVDMVSQLQNANNSFLRNQNVGWLWGHLLLGLLEGNGYPSAATDTSVCASTATGQTNASDTVHSAAKRNSAARPVQQSECVCRSCLAFYIVEAGAAHEAEWCEVSQKERERHQAARRTPPPQFTMLDVLKMECIVNNRHNALLAHLLSRIPVEKHKAVCGVANITATDPMILNYISRGGVVNTSMSVAGFVDKYMDFNKHMHDKWYASAVIQACDVRGGAACATDLPCIRCGDVATTLLVIGELVTKWEVAKGAGYEAWSVVLWRMAVNTALFWLDVEVEKKSIAVTIDGHTTHVPVVLAHDETLLRKASAGEDAAVLQVVLQAMEEAGMSTSAPDDESALGREKKKQRTRKRGCR